MLEVTFRNNEKFSPQTLPELMLTICWFVGPEIEAPPVTDQEYEVIPLGPLNCVVDCGQTADGPPIEQGGIEATVRTTSSVSVQPLAWMAVNRKVAVEEETRALVVKEPGESIVAVPDTTLQEVATIGWSPGSAAPLSGKRVESPSAQRI